MDTSLHVQHPKVRMWTHLYMYSYPKVRMWTHLYMYSTLRCVCGHISTCTATLRCVCGHISTCTATLRCVCGHISLDFQVASPGFEGRRSARCSFILLYVEDGCETSATAGNSTFSSCCCCHGNRHIPHCNFKQQITY